MFETPSPTPGRSLAERQEQLGGTFITNGRLAVTVDGVRTVSEIALEEDFDSLSPSEDDRVLALVHLAAENRADESQPAPAPIGFLIQAGDSQYEARTTTDTGYYVWDAEPSNLDIDFYAGSGRILPGVEVSGWLVFEVPAPINEFDIVWDRTDMLGIESRKPVYWSVSL